MDRLLWMLSAFLDRIHLRDLWRIALITNGCPPDECGTVVVHIQEFDAKDGRGARELIKYLTKDIDSNGDKITPDIYAEVYKAFEGRRMTQASRGFMALAKREAKRCECGADWPRRVRKVKGEKATADTAPETEQ